MGQSTKEYVVELKTNLELALSNREKLRCDIMTEDAIKTQPYSNVTRACAQSYKEENQGTGDEKVCETWPLRVKTITI